MRLCMYPVTLSVTTVLQQIALVLRCIVIHYKRALFKFGELLVSVKKWYISVNFNMNYNLLLQK
jgi:hypothetical protein